MKSEPAFNSLRTIFDRAVELPPDERAAFLSTSCGEDARLRSAVESLLAAHERAGSFLADPMVGTDRLQLHNPFGPGTRIGRYALMRLLGEGGHGAVYLAEQDPPLRRRVALKVIKPGLDTRQVVARFDLERQSLAMMDHPNIAKVFDAGSTDTGQPYFIMELVDGIPVTEFCRLYELDFGARLHLFLSICAAVQHAHEKKVIHRDLKPANVLVILQDGNPLAKVIDFGIAKALLTDTPPGDAQEAKPGPEHKQIAGVETAVLGTPQYMSPEQTRAGAGEVDWRTDIYSLGVLLYELTTDLPPFSPSQFKSGDLGTMFRLIREVNPPSPSERLASAANSHLAHRSLKVSVLKGFDAVVMHAMDKDPGRRYQTVARLADDVERYLKRFPDRVSRSVPDARRGAHLLRGRSYFLTAALVAVAVVGGLLLRRPVPKVQPEAKQPRATTATRAATELSPTAEKQGVWAVYDSGNTRIGRLTEGGKCFSNRNYKFQDLPAEILGLPFTYRAGGKPCDVEIDIATASPLYLLVNSDLDRSKESRELSARLISAGWRAVGRCNYDKYPMTVFAQTFPVKRHLLLRGATFTGIILAGENLHVAKQMLPATR